MGISYIAHTLSFTKRAKSPASPGGTLIDHSGESPVYPPAPEPTTGGGWVLRCASLSSGTDPNTREHSEIWSRFVGNGVQLADDVDYRR